MASSAVNFYSDDGQGCEATAPSNQNLTKLTAIFRAIVDNMSSPRLIPNGTTSKVGLTSVRESGNNI